MRNENFTGILINREKLMDVPEALIEFLNFLDKI
jgi:hypothetical protein